MRPETYSSPVSLVRENALLRSVYNWMMVGLFTSGLAAYFTISNDFMMNLIYGNSFVVWILMLGELGLVFAISGAVRNMTSSTASLLFLLFSFLNGLTLSSIFLVYTARSITSVFLVAGVTFGVTSFYGYVTKRDLTSIGHFLFMGLIGIVIASVVNIFWQNSMFDLLLSYVGVLIFVGLTAYDTQRIKQMGAAMGGSENEQFGRLAVVGALSLYLDFVNLFLMLLRIFGRER